MSGPYFSKQTMTFLRKLDKNNDRDWFEQNKALYEDVVRSPALQFITDMADDLASISPHFVAQAKKVGGSLMRIQRDVRFSKDKRPYKTNIGIQFRHEQGKDVHAPGFYLHVEPGDCFIGVGIWRPDSVALGQIRDAIANQSKKWLSVTNDKTFKKQFELVGESLTNPPRGFAKDHPMITDLKRKDFLALRPIDHDSLYSPRLKKQVYDSFKKTDAFMQFLCKALQLPY